MSLHAEVWILIWSYFSWSVLGLTVCESFPVFKTSIDSLISSLSLGLFKTGVLGRGIEELIRESKKNEIGKFSLLLLESKAYGTLPDEVLMKWALARVEMGVKADFGLPRKLSAPRVYLKLSARSAGWWKSLTTSWGSLVHGLGTPIKRLAASLL